MCSNPSDEVKYILTWGIISELHPRYHTVSQPVLCSIAKDMKELISCTDYVERQQIYWFGHLMRTEHNQPPTKAYSKTKSCYKARGKPRKRWIDNINDILI